MWNKFKLILILGFQSESSSTIMSFSEKFYFEFDAKSMNIYVDYFPFLSLNSKLSIDWAKIEEKTSMLSLKILN